MIYNIFFIDITTDEKLITYFYAKMEEKIIVHIKIKNSRYDLFFMCIHFIPQEKSQLIKNIKSNQCELTTV